jgi:hypothetical protein
MSDLSYPASTRVLYESEILGENLFLALVDQARDDRDRYHFATLLQLESETKVRLRPLLYKHGVSLDETVDLSDDGEGRQWQGVPGRCHCPTGVSSARTGDDAAGPLAVFAAPQALRRYKTCRRKG